MGIERIDLPPIPTIFEEQRKIQEMMDTLSRNEPVAYLHGTPVFTSSTVPKGEVCFVKEGEGLCGKFKI